MSTISTTTGTSSQLAELLARREKMFAKMDTNSDGTVNKEEFVASRPKGMSEADASALYDKMDTQGSNALTSDQLAQGLQNNRPVGQHHHAKGADKSSSTDSDSDDDSDSLSSLGSGLSDDIVATLLKLVSEIGQAVNSASADDKFSKMDTDGDGKISKAEFVAARPSDVSEQDAASLFDDIDTEGTGSITKDQFAQNLPPAPPPPFTASTDSSSSTDQTTASSDSSTAAPADLNSLVAQLLKAIETYVSSTQTGTATSTVSSNV